MAQKMTPAVVIRMRFLKFSANFTVFSSIKDFCTFRISLWFECGIERVHIFEEIPVFIEKGKTALNILERVELFSKKCFLFSKATFLL